ncbi:macrophage colony-stimulating factor 1 receptor 2-like [Notolabrus celidotus]|uniref:macrophage colony-stimulating factor 1 receptor 2-like n=1 Tax=Notolabrus celidotus TaxID=1203425 RepID=UPI00148F7452|nr:macrophage colony-stimulating factor 1 receptor 2-like [Notolabrus celidotus]
MNSTQLNSKLHHHKWAWPYGYITVTVVESVWCLLISDPPWIRLNSDFLPNQTEVVLTAGSSISLSCHGNGSVQWSSTAFRFMFRTPQNPLEVKKSDIRHTGTYYCGYTNQSLEHLVTWIHLYIKDPAFPSSVFVTPNRRPDVKEGQDLLFRCLLTDPSVTNLTLQLVGGEGSGRSLPEGMNVTFDPRRGALIRDLRRSFNGHYVCSGWRDGCQFKSKQLDLLVVPRLRRPPFLSLSQLRSTRLGGEKFEVTCLTSNPTHFYNVTWTHPHTKAVNVSLTHLYSNRLYINSTLTVSTVSQTHTGTYTCTAVNEAGVVTATTYLRVLDQAYLRIYLQPVQQAKANTKAKDVNGELVANISIMSMREQAELVANISNSSLELNGELVANISSKLMYVNGAKISSSRKVEVYEDLDVLLTFVTEAYPPIRDHRWMTPTHLNRNNTVHEESYWTYDTRSGGSLLLRRVRPEDRGRYTFYFSNSLFNGSQHIDLRIYSSPRVVVHQENDSSVCSGSGYPLPTILWYTCPGLQDTCGDISTYQVPPSDVTSQEEEEQVRTHLSLPPSPADDVTVECVAYNQEGMSRQVFMARRPHLLMSPILIGALSAAAVLLLLLLVVFYKLRQKPRVRDSLEDH